MGLLNKIFGGGDQASKFLNSTTGLLDEIITSKEEKLAFKQKFSELMLGSALDSQKVISDRHTSDMTSDSWLSKNVRPASLVFLVIAVTVLSLTDGNIGEFTVNESYVDLYKSLLMMVFSFYFGGRVINKAVESIGKYKIDNGRRKKD